MAFGKVGPGDDVEAWCTRCRMTLNHRIIAMVGSLIQKVQCLTCRGEHKYHPPKNEKSSREVKKHVRVSSGEKTRKPSTGMKPSPERAQSEWNTFMKEFSEGDTPRTYKITEHYSTGEFVEHPNFGVGRIIDILGAEKIEVIFKSGRKVLLFNKKL